MDEFLSLYKWNCRRYVFYAVRVTFRTFSERNGVVWIMDPIYCTKE